MNNIYFYTITIEDKNYRICSHLQNIEKVAKSLGLSKDKVKRGADSRLPFYKQ